MKYSISILTHSALSLAKRCLKSVSKSTTTDYEIILTANGNPEVTSFFSKVASDFPSSLVLDNLKNLGFIEPNNQAFKLSRGEYFVMLNDDAIVPSDWLTKLERPFLDDPKCAISGARGSAHSLSNGFVGFHGSQLEYIEASCMMVKKSCISGDLFSSYLDFAYAEDADLCLRMREVGYTIHEANFNLERHVGGATTATVPDIHTIIKKNLATCQIRWAHYLKHRTFE